jgi:head-tail adaptor
MENTPTTPTPLAPILDPGSLWHVGTVIGKQLVDLPNGGQEWTDVPIVTDEPMSVEPLTGRERAEAGGIVSEATHRLRLHWVAGVRPAQRVTVADPYEGRTRTFEILSVLNIDERAWVLELVVVEKV